MSGRRLVTATSYAVLEQAASRFLNAHAAQGEVLVLAPTKGAADDFLRRAAGAGLMGVHAMTFTQLAARASGEALSRWGLMPVSQLGLEALTARVVHTLVKDGQLSYFTPVADTPGFVRAVAATLTELRMAEVEPGDVARAGAPGADLARLAAAFSDSLIQSSLADLAVVFGMAKQAPSPLLSLPVCLVDVPLRTRRHRAFAATLIERSPDVFAAILSADHESIEAWQDVLGAPAEAETEERSTALSRTRHFLFSPKVERAPGLDDTLEYFSAPGEGHEAVEILRRIGRLAAAGTPFDRIAILLRDPDRYQPLIEEALRRAGVPGYFPRGTARPDPAGRAFLALLACAAEGCPASRFAEYLSLAQVPNLTGGGAPVPERAYHASVQDELLAGFARAEAPEPAAEPAPSLEAPFGWEQLLVDAAVVGGQQRWRRRLEGLARELHLQLQQLPNESEAHRGAIERRLAQLQALGGFALPLIDLLSSLPRAATWGEWIEHLTALAETALRRPESVVAILNELLPMTNVGPAGLDEVYRVLDDRLRFLRREPPQRRFGAVWVGSIEEARGRTFDVVFLPGLAEGLFPRRASEDPLLIDVHRATLDAGLANQDLRIARERLLLHVAAAAGARLIVSYPRMDVVESRSRVPSFYALEVIRAAQGSFPDLKQFEKSAARAAATRLGWPAPREAANAIDDAEFDLATLEHALNLPPGKAKGAARYLMQASPILARSLRARWQRWSPDWSPSDGLVSVRDMGKNLLDAHRLNARLYSATTLEQYTACPYKFFLRGIQQLRPRDSAAPLEQLDPATRGALFHEIQHEIYQAGTFETGDLETALDTADRITDRVAARYAEELAPAIPRVWQTEIEDLRTDLRAWVRHVVRVGRDWAPLHSELSFGDPPVTIASAQLRGAIDLVERHRERPVLRITDHKTGRPPNELPIYVGGGASLQPILYSLAAEQILGQTVDHGRLFYCTHRGNYKELEIRVSEPARAHAAKALALIGKAIEDAFLPAAPRQDACAVCDYRLVCGPYEEQRWQRKQGKRIEPLKELRGLP